MYRLSETNISIDLIVDKLMETIKSIRPGIP